MGSSERQRELRRRRKRKKKLAIIERKAAKASVSEKQALAFKLRFLTPGAEIVIDRLELESRA